MQGVAFGSGIGCIGDVADTALSMQESEKGYRGGVSPFFVPRILCNMAAGHISIRFGLRGPNHSASTACATGAHSIGDAFRLIKFGGRQYAVATQRVFRYLPGVSVCKKVLVRACMCVCERA